MTRPRRKTAGNCYYFQQVAELVEILCFATGTSASYFTAALEFLFEVISLEAFDMVKRAYFGGEFPGRCTLVWNRYVL
jgi:hypothetical protein